MRIGLLTTSFPRHEGDPAGSFVLGFARALAQLGHRVEVLAPEPAAPAATPNFAPLTLSWVPYLRPRALQRTFYGAGVPDNLAANPLAWLGLLPFPLALAKQARRRVEHWDALVSHWALPCALVAATLAGTRPHLAVLHSADVALLERLPGRARLAERIARGACALVFSSQDLRRRFAALLSPLSRGELAGAMHVCAMGIDPLPSQPSGQARAALRRSLGLSDFTLLSLGRLVPIKGLEHAIEAVAGLPQVELVIAGEGPARPALASLAQRAGARVRFLGLVQGAEKDAWFRAADAFVLPSVRLASGRSEGTPTTLLEAMQRGLPVIASRQGGVPDLIEHDHNGWLVPPGESQALRAAVVRLQAAPELRARLAEAGRETAELFTWDKLGPHFAELLGER